MRKTEKINNNFANVVNNCETFNTKITKKQSKDILIFNEKNYAKFNYLNRYYTHYENHVCSDFLLKQNIQNISEIPKLEKITLNTTHKTIVHDKKHIIPSLIALELISGHKLKWTSAKKSIASFKLRKNQPIGCKIDLRNKNMFTFLEKLVAIILPRVRNFKAINTNSFNYKGNLTLGLSESLIFSELENYFEYFQALHGIDITIVTTIKTKKNKVFTTKTENVFALSALILLSGFQFPTNLEYSNFNLNNV